MSFARSEELFKNAQKVIPGGVNSPVRAFRSVGMHPLFIKRAKGCRIEDADGNSYIDMVSSWGPMILGHADPEIEIAAIEAIKNGTSYGAPTELELVMAELVVKAVPSIEKVRMVSSGTEAAMSAIRVARGFTGRDKIVKFVGCYHGHSDSMLVHAGSGVATLGLPDSPGVTAGAAQDTVTLNYNDMEAVKTFMDAHGSEVAAVIVEPVAGNMGVVPPRDGYLQLLRDLTTKHGALLIFDEVITGFRVSYGGAQELFGITPDLTVLGKIIGGGFPVGAFGGRAVVMDSVAPVGAVYQAGTLSGNPVAMATGIRMLELLREPGVYEILEARANMLAKGIGDIAAKNGIPVYQTRVGSMQCAFFTSTQVYDYDTAKTSDTERYAKYFRALIDRGIYFAPSQFEACFVSTAHSEQDIADILQAISEVMPLLSA